MRSLSTLAALFSLVACTDEAGRAPSGDTAESMTGAGGSVPAPGAPACLVSAQSVLARAPGSVAPGPDHLRGWIRLERFLETDTGTAKLIDSDGFMLEASWSRRNDSVVVAGSNDFVRIEMRLRVADSAARGSLRAHSDAALERDSAGKLREFRREGTINFQYAPCDSMPPLNSRAGSARF